MSIYATSGRPKTDLDEYVYFEELRDGFQIYKCRGVECDRESKNKPEKGIPKTRWVQHIVTKCRGRYYRNI